LELSITTKRDITTSCKRSASQSDYVYKKGRSVYIIQEEKGNAAVAEYTPYVMRARKAK
jgi:hypothetical protein